MGMDLDGQYVEPPSEEEAQRKFDEDQAAYEAQRLATDRAERIAEEARKAKLIMNPEGESPRPTEIVQPDPCAPLKAGNPITSCPGTTESTPIAEKKGAWELAHDRMDQAVDLYLKLKEKLSNKAEQFKKDPFNMDGAAD
jgi:hypothetical protein